MSNYPTYRMPKNRIKVEPKENKVIKVARRFAKWFVEEGAYAIGEVFAGIFGLLGIWLLIPILFG